MSTYKILRALLGTQYLIININCYYYCAYPIFYSSEGQDLLEPDFETRNVLH